VIDPEVPAAARRELEQASLSALVGFSDPLPKQDPPRDRDRAGSTGQARPPGVRLAVGAIVMVMGVLLIAGLATPGPFSADLVFLAVLIGLPCAAAGGLHLVQKARGSVPELSGGRPWARRGAAVAYRRRYVVPELDLYGDTLARWQRASQAARTIRASESVRLGLINSVEVAAVLPYHLWDVAERLALLSGPERRQASILRGLDVTDPDVQLVLGPQRKAHELALADIDRRIGRLEEFAALASKADAARKRRRALEELAGLNGDYQELLVRLGDLEDALTEAGRPAGELRAMAAEADDAVRLANEAGRALILPPAVTRLPVPGWGGGSRPNPFGRLREGSGGCLAAVTVAGGGDRSAFRASDRADDQPLVVEQRRDQPVLEGHVPGPAARAAGSAGGLGHGEGLERAVGEQARVALHVAAVVPVVVDAVRVVGQRGEAEKQGGGDADLPFALAGRDHRRCRRRRRRLR
jgi:hypothetical protein